ncbi:hypothetical protein ACN3E9_08490 [Vibrio pectenicida]|uniref:hypothetical protein n=1 Tax=Vibrio pectenicida TaxID=62763 RepID=UPI003B98E7F9
MQVINKFRAHVLHHSSAAEKMGKHELARNIVSVKQEKNEGKCSKFIDKISAQLNFIQNINEKRTLDKNTKKKRITHIQIKLQCNEGKLNKLLDKQDGYQSKIALEKLSSNNKNDLISINEDHDSYKNVANEKLGEQLIKHYGLEAEQYLDDLGHGFTESETMAIGLYTNGEYKALNQELREGQNLSEGNALIDKG